MNTTLHIKDIKVLLMIKLMINLLCIASLKYCYGQNPDKPIFESHVAYYDNGNMMSRGQYFDGERMGMWYHYDHSGEYLASYGEYDFGLKIGQWVELDSLELPRIESSYQDGKLDGTQITYHGDGRIAIERTFNEGELVSTKYIDTIGLETKWCGEISPPYLDKCGKSEGFNTIDSCNISGLFKNLRYPKTARENGIEGKALFLLEFSVDGRIENVRTLLGVSPEIEKECRRVIALVPKFNPATFRGKPVPFTTVMPFIFKLE